MEVSYDFWSGESLQDLIQTIAEFRLQLFSDTDKVKSALSEEITFLQNYFDTEASVIVANDCGQIVGYQSLISYSDQLISEGPIVHPEYRNMGIGKGLMQESIECCELKDIVLFIIDPVNIMSEKDLLAIESLAKQFNLDTLINNKKIYQKNFNS